jgi:subtilase-type serine protease
MKSASVVRRTVSSLPPARLTVAIAGTLLAAAAAPALASDTPWRTAEFEADWGLGAINADAAYARGLSGHDIRLGVLDTGTGLDHPELAGKDHRSIHLAQRLADGSRCTNTTLLTGPGACFSSDGDVVAVDATLFQLDQDVIDFLNSLGLYEGLAYNNHGTHVSGTIAANRDGNGMHGVAFGANLSVARMFFNTGRVFVRDPITGLDIYSLGRIGPDNDVFADFFAQSNAQQVRAINHSWGFGLEPTTTDEQDGYFANADYAEYFNVFAEGSRQRGVIQVWAAGNTHAPNDSPETAPIAGLHPSLPRAYQDIEPYWLSVVNVDQSLTLSDRSMRCGPTANWCIAAPGTDITSTVYGADSQLLGGIAVIDGENAVEVTGATPTFAYEDLSGTSMAAPHVTGALGLLFERFPYLDSAQVRDVLLTTATDLGAEGVDDVYGWGLVNLAGAIEGYGQLRVDTHVVMDRHAGGLKVWEGGAWDDWTHDIGGPGRLTKSGIGWLRLSGDNSFNGATVREGLLELDGVNTLTGALDVDGGHLLLNGALRDMAFNQRQGSSHVSAGGVLDNSTLAITGGVVSFNGVQTGGSTRVGTGGLLKGTGVLADTRVEGILAPGNSLGTLTIDGDYVQTASGVYQAELSPGGQSDLLHVTGTARLDGALQALPEAGAYYLGEQFNILVAEGGVSGTFATADFSAFSPFLQFGLVYAPTEARIDVTRGRSLASAASTANQRAVAMSIDGLAVDQGLPRPLTQLFPEQGGAALDSLSGELHAAIPMVLVESSRYLRDAALGRALAQRAPGSGEDPATGAWVQAFGGSTRLDGNANAARTESTSNGLLVGAGHGFGKGWQVGALLGTGRTDLKQGQGRRARSELDTTHLGATLGRQWGGLGLRAGLGYSRHDVDTHRELAFNGFRDVLAARYHATTRQAFLEGAYRFGGAAGGLEPYLQVARVHVEVDSLAEQGGAAALQGSVADTYTTLATAGLRFDRGLRASFQNDHWLHVLGGLGYRRASGDRNQVASLGVSGGSTFAVGGAGIVGHAVVAELGLSAWLSPRQRVELGYNGQFGSDGRDHALNARWSVQF